MLVCSTCLVEAGKTTLRNKINKCHLLGKSCHSFLLKGVLDFFTDVKKKAENDGLVQVVSIHI